MTSARRGHGEGAAPGAAAPRATASLARAARRAAAAAALALAAASVAAAPAAAQVVRAFTPRFSTNDNGDIALIGNTLMSCTGGGGCTNGRNGTGGSVNNNDFSMQYVDVDGDATTFASSRATLALPAGATVLWAGLYWQGDSNSGLRNTVRLATPAAGYVTVTAAQLDAYGTAYSGYADVTAQVRAGGNGVYTVADVRSTTGSNRFAGWALVVVHRDPTQPPRNLVVFDGYAHVAPGATVTMGVAGFLTPPSGAVNTRLGVVAGEGDRGLTGDAFRLNGTALSDAVNPATNFFNSTVSGLGAHVTSKTPHYVNQLGWDVDLVSASGVLANGATSATIALSSSGDRYYPGVVTFATELYQPILEGSNFTKSASDVNGAPLRPGETIEYVVTLANGGNDGAVGVTLRDTIPASAAFVPGSIEVVSGAGAGPKSDAPGDDEADYDPASRSVVVRLGSGAGATAGGTLAPGASAAVRFRVTVTPPAPGGSLISNQAVAEFRGAQLGTAFVTRSDGDLLAPGFQRTDVTVTASALSGTVFEDANYGGGAGRSLTAAAGAPSPGARVELYDAGGAFLAADTTDAAGRYAFEGWPAGAYTVRVVNATVRSARPGWHAGLVPVQTFRAVAPAGVAVPDPDRVGGEEPSKRDAAANLAAQPLAALAGATTAVQSVAPVTLGTADLAGVDFGFSFSTVVNPNDDGQGSLRQALLNANALANAGLAQAGHPPGIETTVFMVAPGAPRPGLRAGLPSLLDAGRVRISLLTPLPAITDALRLDGATQTAHGGDTNPGALGAGGTAGVDALTVATVPAPEVEIADGAGLPLGLDLQAAGTVLRHVAVTGFGGAPDDPAHANVRVGAAAAGVTIEQAVIGAPATAFADPGAARSGGDGVRVEGADDGVVRESLIGFHAGSGVALASGAERWTVSASEIRGNGVGHPARDGIAVGAGSSATLRGNLVAGQSGSGVDARDATLPVAIESNTIEANGAGGAAGETPGVRLGRAAHRVERNVIRDNAGAGVLVAADAAAVLVSRNAMHGNGAAGGGLGIDLLAAGEDDARGAAPFVTVNDPGDGDAGANGLLNFPVLESAAIVSGTLTVSGWARPGSAIELFIAEPDPSGFGEGRTWLATLVEGSGADADASSGAYAGPVNALAQGADHTSRFRFTLPLPPGVTGGTPLTATATLDGATSEFSGLVVAGGTVSVRGFAYADADHNADRDPAEAGTGAALWVKLVDPLLPAVAQQVVAADPLTGAWTLNFVPPGAYTVVLDDNALAADVAPSRPAGFLGTENAAGAAPVVVGTVDLAGPDFGLFHGSTVSGRVFRDDGAGGGSPNDGARQAGEAGLAGVRVAAFAAGCAGGACDSTLTDAAGDWRLWLPHGAGAVTVRETNPAGWLSTGGGAGTTGGAYDRSADALTFAPASGAEYAGVSFGDVPPATWGAAGARSVMPGAAAFYAHVFTAGSAGTLVLSTAGTPSPAIAGWDAVLYHDLDADGALDPGEPALSAPLALATGQSVAVLVRHASPAGAPPGASEALAVTAAFELAGAAPALATSATLVDLTTVGATGGLVLAKSADLASARPGDVITYTVTYFNPGPAPVTAIEIHDATPAFTTFVDAACGALGAGLGGCALAAQPAPGAAGAVRWSLAGALAPGASGAVTFRVRVEGP
uniref:DUF11 domain-containing protein n=1 Tax=Eiseniibacteriota bacterium TaxID=2212470 RepID=A0A832I359_UNCEI